MKFTNKKQIITTLSILSTIGLLFGVYPLTRGHNNKLSSPDVSVSNVGTIELIIQNLKNIIKLDSEVVEYIGNYALNSEYGQTLSMLGVNKNDINMMDNLVENFRKTTSFKEYPFEPGMTFNAKINFIIKKLENPDLNDKFDYSTLYLGCLDQIEAFRVPDQFKKTEKYQTILKLININNKYIEFVNALDLKDHGYCLSNSHMPINFPCVNFSRVSEIAPTITPILTNTFERLNPINYKFGVGCVPKPILTNLFINNIILSEKTKPRELDKQWIKDNSRHISINEIENLTQEMKNIFDLFDKEEPVHSCEKPYV